MIPVLILTHGDLATELLQAALYLSVGSKLCSRRLPVSPVLVALFELLPLTGRLADRVAGNLRHVGGRVVVDLAVLAAGVIAAFVSGWLAIGFMLRYLRDHSTGIFIAYRLIAAAVFLVLLLVNA